MSSSQLTLPLALGAGTVLVGSTLFYLEYQKQKKILQETIKQNEELEEVIKKLKSKSEKKLRFDLDEQPEPQPHPPHLNEGKGLTFPPIRGPKRKPSLDNLPTHKKRIAVMSSGGDSCGMNAALRSIVRVGIHFGAQMFVIYEGYTGLVTGGNLIKPADWDFVGGILHKGGTVIGSARCSEFRTKEGRKSAAYNLVKEGIDCLVVIGGDGSLTGADLFRREWTEYLQELVDEGKLESKVLTENSQLSIVGLVGSIDNDMCGTDLTIGVDTALHRILECIDAVLSTASSHRRTFILEIMGRNCGYLAMMAALCTGADWVFIPESPPVEGWEEHIVTRFNRGRDLRARCSMVIMAEGAVDIKGKPISCEYVRGVLAKAGHEARVTILGHVQRGGTPSIIDRNNSTLMGEEVIHTLYDDEFVGKSTMIGIEGTKVVRRPLMECVEQTKEIGKAMNQLQWDLVLEMRGEIFKQTHKVQTILSKTCPSPPPTVPPKRTNIGILHIGAPAPGMNTAVRVVARLALERGHKIYAFKNGIKGLIEDNVQELDWVSVNGWSIIGGANLGTARGKDITNWDDIAKTLSRYKIETLIMIGGYDGYEFMVKVHKLKEQFNAFNISLVCIPATISNNIPATQSTIGCDTALNNIIQAVDKIKQSSGISQRVFVLEVMGGYSGYLAVLSSLGCGAEFTHIHENQVTIRQLQEESNILVDRFKSGKNISLIIMNEKANPTYGTDFVFSLLKQEAQGLYDVRKCILGHLQQGGAPSPADRILASHLGMKLFEFMDNNIDSDPETLSIMVGISEGKPNITPLSKFDSLVDAKYRRPKLGGQNFWWYPKVCDLTDKLGTEPKTIGRALRHSTEDAMCREQKFIDQESQSEHAEEEPRPRVYRSWTFQRFDYDETK